MSVTAMSLVFSANMPELKTDNEKTVPDSTAKFVLLALADHASEDGENAYIGIRRICQKTNLSTSTVCNAINALRKAGFITLVGKSNRDTNNYTINLNRLQPLKFQPLESRDSSQWNPSVLAVETNPSVNHQLTTLTEGEVKSISQSANRKVDAIIDLEKQSALKVNYPKREALPEPIRELIDAWVIASGIKPLAREVSGLLMEGQNWLNLGATGDDIKAAWEYAKANYPAPPSSPFGLTNTLRNLKAGNLKNKNESNMPQRSVNHL